jgi:hypothetical protein
MGMRYDHLAVAAGTDGLATGAFVMSLERSATGALETDHRKPSPEESGWPGNLLYGKPSEARSKTKPCREQEAGKAEGRDYTVSSSNDPFRGS